jgi:hypothetical protein
MALGWRSNFDAIVTQRSEHSDMKSATAVRSRRRWNWAVAGFAFLGGPTLLLAIIDSPFADSDRDGLPDWRERMVGTDPHNADTDGDGLRDGWELFGVIPAHAAPGDNPTALPISGANPLRKDIFVEVDWMRDASHTHQFRRAAIDRVEESFTRAPVANPSGEIGVNNHIDTGQLGGGGDEIEHQTLLPVGTGSIQVPGVGDLGQGAAIVIGNIDGDPAPEMVLMAYDNPAGPNTVRIAIGRNIDTPGSLGAPFGFPRDWNGNGSYESCVANNVNSDMDGNGQAVLGTLTDWNDWANLVL